MMNAFWIAGSVPANGPALVSSSVESSMALTAVIGFRTAASGFFVFGSTKRSRLYLATSALKGEPSWNLTPWRSLKRHVVSFTVSQDTASAGWGTSCGSSATSVSKMAFIMLRENALVVTRGSSDSASTPSTRVASPVAGAAGAAAGLGAAVGAGAVVGAGGGAAGGGGVGGGGGGGGRGGLGSGGWRGGRLSRGRRTGRLGRGRRRGWRGGRSRRTACGEQ